jgi:hypothetical protein
MFCLYSYAEAVQTKNDSASPMGLAVSNVYLFFFLFFDYIEYRHEARNQQTNQETEFTLSTLSLSTLLIPSPRQG